jgi:hypothetical protein
MWTGGVHLEGPGGAARIALNDVALLLLPEHMHMAVGVSATGIYGSYYEYGGIRYYYLETVGDGGEIGQIPPSITNTIAHIYPL